MHCLGSLFVCPPCPTLAPGARRALRRDPSHHFRPPSTLLLPTRCRCRLPLPLSPTRPLASAPFQNFQPRRTAKHLHHPKSLLKYFDDAIHTQALTPIGSTMAHFNPPPSSLRDAHLPRYGDADAPRGAQNRYVHFFSFFFFFLAREMRSLPPMKQHFPRTRESDRRVEAHIVDEMR